MRKVLVFLADGFEESEAICPIDMLKRAGIEVVMAGVDSLEVKSSHGINIKADILASDVNVEGFDAIFCPGGMPGAVNLAQCWSVNEAIINLYNNGGIIAAICASPAVVLAPLGLLDGKKATCYPGCESYAPSISFLPEGLVVDGRIITAKSAGFAFDLGLELIRALQGDEDAEKVQKSIYYKD